MQKFLRQLVTGRVYHWTPQVAKRADMVEMDPETARVRLQAHKAQLAAIATEVKDPEKVAQRQAEVREVLGLAKELTETENKMEEFQEAKRNEALSRILEDETPDLKPNEIDTDASKRTGETPQQADDAALKASILRQDKEYQAILAMKTKQDVVDYLAAQFGVKEDPSKRLDILRQVALSMREQRLFEKV